MMEKNGVDKPLPPPSAISMHQYWTSTVFACETALQLLKPFEHNDYYLVNDVIGPLRQLVSHGRNYEAMKQYQPHRSMDETQQQQRQQQVVVRSQHQQQQQQSFLQRTRKTVQLNFDPRTNWRLEGNDTVHVHTHHSNSKVTCKAITTVEQLEKAIPVIQQAPYLGLDCEFLGLKKALPELQVLQVAVSSTLGYAIMVNQIGPDKVYQRLGPILEEEFDLADNTTVTQNTNDDMKKGQQRLLLGWAFRADAQAIEASFRKIKLTRVLDLQAKMQSLATEQMNLKSAMSRYCQDWDALEEFSKAKQLGDTFQFTGPECIWLHAPLSPEALVYAVFDVVSLVALYEQTKVQPTLVNHYWPNTVISTYGRKALEKWYRQKIMSQQEPVNSQAQHGQQQGEYISLVETPAVAPVVSTKKAGKAKMVPHVPSTHTSLSSSSSSLSQKGSQTFDWDDENPQYEADMEEAIRRSKQDYLHQQQNTEERIIGTLDEPSGSTSTSFHCETIDFNHMPEENTTTTTNDNSYNLDDEVIPFSSFQKGMQSHHYFDDDNGEEEEEKEEKEAEDLPFEQTNNDLHFADDIYDEGHKDSKEIGQLGGWGSSDEIQETDWKSSYKESSKEQEPQQVPNHTYYEKITQAYMQHAEGEFAWAMRPEDETWSKLAENSIKGWKAGMDSEADWQEMARQAAEMENAPKDDEGEKNKTTRFHTSTHFSVGDWARHHEKDSWDAKHEQPQAMMMPMRNIPKLNIKNKKRGPRVVNPFDDMMSSSEDESDDQDSSMRDKNDEGSLDGTEEKVRSKTVVETYRDDLHLDGESVHVHLVTSDQQLSTVQLDTNQDDNKKVVFITPLLRQVVHREGTTEILLKGVQIYVVPTGESYTLLVDRLVNHNELEQSELGNVLKHPKVTRVVWGIAVAEQQIKEQLGFSLGPCIDLCWTFNEMFGSPDNPITFSKALDMGLHNQKNREIYRELCEYYHSKKKFSGSPWDQDRIQDNSVHYSAMQGWLLAELYQFCLTHPELQMDKFILPPHPTDQIAYSIAVQ